VRRGSLDGRVVGAGRVAAARALDLDDPRAELGELTRGEGAGDDLLERDDGDSLERSHVKCTVRPGNAMPANCVLQTSPGATGCASVSVPVLTISPVRSVSSSRSSRVTR